MAQETRTVSALTIGGTAFLADLTGVNYSIEHDTVRDDTITDDMVSEQVVKASAKIDTPLLSTISTPERVSHLNLTALSLGAEDLLTNYGVESLSLEIGYERAEKPTTGVLFPYPQNTKKRISGSVSFAVPDSGAIPQLRDAASGTYTDRVKALSFTLNSIVTTLPVLMKNVKITGENSGLLMVSADLGPRKPTSGAYPAAPTGTTTLLEKAFNSYRTALAIVCDSAAAGERLAGNFIFDSVKIEVKNKDLVTVAYSWISQGAFTVTSLA